MLSIASLGSDNRWSSTPAPLGLSQTSPLRVRMEVALCSRIVCASMRSKGRLLVEGTRESRVLEDRAATPVVRIEGIRVWKYPASQSHKQYGLSCICQCLGRRSARGRSLSPCERRWSMNRWKSRESRVRSPLPLGDGSCWLGNIMLGVFFALAIPV